MTDIGLSNEDEKLKELIEQIQAGNAEKKIAADHVREIYATAKAEGYDTKALRKLIRYMESDKGDLAQQEALFELYKNAAGVN